MRHSGLRDSLDVLVEDDEASFQSGSSNDGAPPGRGSAHDLPQQQRAEEGPQKSRYSLYHARSVSLDILKLSYTPAPIYLNEALHKLTNLTRIDRVLPGIRDMTIRTLPRIAPLHDVSVCMQTHRLIALIGTDFAEQCTLMDLIAGRCTTGEVRGNIALNGISEESFYSDKFAFVPHSTVIIPGFTYLEAVTYAARLRLSHLKVNVSIDARVTEVMALMGLRDCQHRVIPEFPPTRGVIGRDLRLLSIAVEIVTLPPLIIIDDPVLALEPGVANKLFERLRALADRGHIVLCNIPRLNPLLVPHFHDVVVLSDGHSVYSGSVSGAERYFCSNTVGYKLGRGVDMFTFLLDIASGTERPAFEKRRRGGNITASELQSSFESSKQFLPPEITPRSVSAFSKELFFLCGYGEIDSPVTIAIRAYVTIERALVSKFKDTETMKRSLVGSIVISLLIGYIQYQQGSYGYYTMTSAKYPYLNTANTTALMFFCSIFAFSQQLINAHVLCAKVKLFKYERSSTLAFLFGTLLSELPFAAFYCWLFSSVIYFMAELNKGYANYFFFVDVLCLQACIGSLSVLLVAAVFRGEEIAVRDVLFGVTFLMLMTSGFPFQLSFMNDFVYSMTTVNPARYTFEALMSWKFVDYYADGYYYLQPFSFQNFNSAEVFTILRNFVIFAILVIYFALWPKPMLLKLGTELQLGNLTVEESTKSTLHEPFRVDNGTNGFDDDDDDDDIEAPLNGSGTPRRGSHNNNGGSRKISDTGFTPKVVKPVIFSRESSITQNSKLSINGALSTHVSGTPDSKTTGARGPTVAFRDLTYRVKDRKSPLGYKVVINNASGQFDWGKLNCIMAGSQGGKSSLLHIIAGDTGPRTDLQGSVYYNHNLIDMTVPLWQRCALVEAKDEQYVFLTVRETVTFAMQLRCAAGEHTFAMVGDSVKGVLETLHLDDVADKKVKYLTPGQRRRLSIAEEIVFGPTLLLIDEPTTSLDPLDESVMMTTFREMVNQDRTVVATINEPSPNAFALFDKILLLSKGRVIYHGPPNAAYKFFINCPYGFEFKPYMSNPGEFLLDISCGLLRTTAGDIMESTALEEYYKNSDTYKTFMSALMSYQGQQQQSQQPSLSGSFSSFSNMEGFNKLFFYDSFPSASRKSSAGSRRNNFFLCFSSSLLWAISLRRNDVGVLLRTSWIVFYRATLALINRWHLTVATTVGHILLACLFGWIVGDAGNNLYDCTSFFAVSTLFMLLFNLQFIFIIFKSNEVFLKENARGLCPTFVQWFFAPLPLYCLRFSSSIFYSVIVYSLLNLNSQPENFGYFITGNMFVVMGGTMMAEFVVQAVPDIRSAYILIPGLVFIQFLFSGLFIKQTSLPYWLGVFAPELSMIKWSMQGNFINQFQYNYDVFPKNDVYDFYVAFLTLFEWQDDSKETCVWVILAFCVVFKTISLIVMGLTSIYQRGGRSFKKLIEDFSE